MNKLLNFRHLAIVLAVLILIVGYAGHVQLFSPLTAAGNDTLVEVEIEPGMGTQAIAALLEEKGVIRSAFGFTLAVTLSGDSGSLKAGRYLFCPCQPVGQIAETITEGEALSTDIEILITEGSNIWEVDKRLTSAGLIKEGELAKAYPHKEGHLFPDTYRFAPGTPLEKIVERMEANYMAKAAVRSDIALIVASMLEKEAKTPEDMALVAGIIEKRIQKGMLLQIDATVGYGWCVKRFTKTGKDCDVTQAPIASEIKIDGPYNTYMRSGLPPAAISNPGLNALKAASNPKSSDYFYYLSTRDGSQIIYSKTHDEHLRNRAKYLGF